MTSSPASSKSRPESRKTEIGVVTSDKMSKTRRVVVERLSPHPKYGKYMRSRTVLYAHDGANETHVGDVVEVAETRPLSKLKRWRVTRIVRMGNQRQLAEAAPAPEPQG